MRGWRLGWDARLAAGAPPVNSLGQGRIVTCWRAGRRSRYGTGSGQRFASALLPAGRQPVWSACCSRSGPAAESPLSPTCALPSICEKTATLAAVNVCRPRGSCRRSPRSRRSSGRASTSDAARAHGHRRVGLPASSRSSYRSVHGSVGPGRARRPRAGAGVAQSRARGAGW